MYGGYGVQKERRNENYRGMNNMYLIDTDTLVFLGRGKVSIQEKMNLAGLSHCFLSEISMAELYVGMYKRAEKESFIVFLEENFKALPIGPSIKTFAKTRASLEKNGIRLEDFDILIAATALDNDYTLVTHNTRHFSRIPGLKLEDWVQD